jgi:hypothetical protein
LRINGIEIKRFTVFYRCEGVERIVDALKNIEKAVVDEYVIERLSKEIFKNVEKGSFGFNLDVRMRYKDLVLDFEKPIKVHVKCKIVEEPDYLAVSTTPNTIRVIADLKRDPDFIRCICEELAEHIPKALGLKNAIEFFDLDVVKEKFDEKINEIGCNVKHIADILRDFVEYVLKDFEDRIVICRDCRVLKHLTRFKGVILVTDCPILLDKIVERVRLSKLSGRELRRIGLDKSSVIKPEDFALHMLRVVA